jgi:hypothetical protein
VRGEAPGELGAAVLERGAEQSRRSAGEPLARRRGNGFADRGREASDGRSPRAGWES